MRDIIFRLPALSLLRPAIPWSLPMYPLPVEIGIARYNIARSVAMTSFVSPLRSLYKVQLREHECCRSSQYRYSLCGQHVYPILKPEKLSEDTSGVWHSVSIPLKDFGLNAVNDTNIKEISGRSPSSRYGRWKRIYDLSGRYRAFAGFPPVGKVP